MMKGLFLLLIGTFNTNRVGSKYLLVQLEVASDEGKTKIDGGNIGAIGGIIAATAGLGGIAGGGIAGIGAIIPHLTRRTPCNYFRFPDDPDTCPADETCTCHGPIMTSDPPQCGGRAFCEPKELRRRCGGIDGIWCPRGSRCVKPPWCVHCLGVCKPYEALAKQCHCPNGKVWCIIQMSERPDGIPMCVPKDRTTGCPPRFEAVLKCPEEPITTFPPYVTRVYTNVYPRPLPTRPPRPPPSAAPDSSEIDKDYAICTKEDISLLDGLDTHKQALDRCLMRCAARRPIFTCIGACIAKYADKKITPKCMQCFDDMFSCASTKCGNNCRDVKVPLNNESMTVECVMCFMEKCVETAMACGLTDRAMHRVF